MASPYEDLVPAPQKVTNPYEDLIPQGAGEQQGEVAALDIPGGVRIEDPNAPPSELEFQPRGDWRSAVWQGLTFNGGDELSGWARDLANHTPLPDWAGWEPKTGDQVREDQRDNYAAYSQRRPWASAGFELLGALPSMFLPGANVARGANMLSRVGRAMLAGGGYGAFAGHNQGEGEFLSEDRRRGAITQGATGAVVGGGLVGAGEGAVKGVRALADALTKNPASKAGVNRPAQRELARVLADDDVTLPELGQRLSEYGPDAALADGSDGLREAARVMTQTGAPGSRPLRDLGVQRSKEAPKRIERAFEGVLGKRPAPAEEMAALRDTLRQRAKANYASAERSAKGKRIATPDALAGVLSERRGQLAREGAPASAAPSDSYEFLSEVQKRVSEDLGLLRKSPHITASTGAQIRALRADENTLAKTLSDATDGFYGKARRDYAHDSKAKDAFDWGFRKALSPQLEKSFFKQEWDALSPTAQEAARVGARAWLGQKAGNVRGGRTVARDTLTEGDAQDKLAIMFGDDVAKRLAAAMEGQERMWVTDDALKRAAGSQTARNTSNRLNPGNEKAPLDVSMLGLGGRAAQGAYNMFRDPTSLKRSLGPALAKTGADRDELVRALIASESVKQQSPNALADALANTAGAPAGSTTSKKDISRFYKSAREIPHITVRPRRDRSR